MWNCSATTAQQQLNFYLDVFHVHVFLWVGYQLKEDVVEFSHGMLPIPDGWIQQLQW